jgi:hypothetical protein
MAWQHSVTHESTAVRPLPDRRGGFPSVKEGLTDRARYAGGTVESASLASVSSVHPPVLNQALPESDGIFSPPKVIGMNPLLALLTHRPFPEVAEALRSAADDITVAWDAAVRQAMPQMGT